MAYQDTPCLHLFFGNIASGKSTLAARIAQAPGHVSISEDTWLGALFGQEMQTIEDYLQASAKLRAVLRPHLVELLCAGVSVVLDFQANTVESRAWIRSILEETRARHRLHILSTPDDICIARLQARNAEGQHPFAVTEEQFRHISQHIALPTEDEGFDLVWHKVQSEV